MKLPFNHFSRKIQAFVCLMATSTTVAWLAFAAPVKIELPRETETFKPGNGFEIANAHCLICHSADYVAIQPPLARAFWKNSVQKMQQKYGATIPEEQVEPLVGYLVKTYGTEKSEREKLTAGLTPRADIAAPSSTDPTDPAATAEGGKLAAKFGCAGCHSVDRKIVGPAFKDIAAKYRGHVDALEKVSHQIIQGGGGQWGTIPMPPFPRLSAAEVKALSDWVLGQK
ncbi:MAG: c-type cytochrome [Verrucomicrobiota bacterium]